VRGWQATLVLAAALAAAFPDVLVGGRTLSAAAWVPGVLPGGPVGARLPPAALAPRDPEGAAWVDEPAPYLVGEALRSGRVPLWNPREGLGLPLLGNPNTAALAPLQWAVEIRPDPFVQDLAWLVRAFVLGAFTWLLARRIGCGPVGSLVAACATMLSGQTVLWIAHHPLHVDAFVPLAIAAAIGLPASGRRGTALLAAAVAAGLLAVKPQSAIVAGACGLAWIVAEGFERRRTTNASPGERVAARLLACLAGVALGALAAAVALVPFAETWMGASALARAGRSTQSEWTLPPSSAVSLLGRLAAPPAPSPGVVGGATSAAGLPWVGTGVLVAAVAGLARARRRPLAWALAATSAILLARIHGLLPIPLAGVPVAGSIQLVKYCFPLYLGLALLAGLAFPSARTGGGSPGLAPGGVRARPALVSLAAVAIVAELAWNCDRPRPRRVPLYAPAPWVEALRTLDRERPGRIAGPVDLAPPLVSAALGFRDLRSIDVLTPGDSWRSVQELVAPSRGVTWVTADPAPLLAATAPGAAVADLRWILAREPLRAEDLPGATRAAISARRLPALLVDVERWKIETAALSGGLDAFGGEERFHWTCTAPCRLVFEMRRLPPCFAVGLGAPEEATVVVRLEATVASGGRSEATGTASLQPSQPAWRDFRLPAPEGGAGAPGRIVVSIESDRPARVFAGGVGPAPSEAGEHEQVARELAARLQAFRSLVLRHSDQDATIYENPAALGAAWMAQEVVPSGADDAVFECVRSRPGRPVACVSEADVAALGNGWPGRSSGRLSVVEDGAERAVAQVEAPDGGVAVFSRLFHPGWEATIDGRPAARVRASGGLTAVPVPPGTHRVELAYRPRSVFAGAALSLLGAVVIAWLACDGRRR
jgi:hypothetical protein